VYALQNLRFGKPASVSVVANFLAKDGAQFRVVTTGGHVTAYGHEPY
jgi:hypothetical protein